jgi:hypothetical protein
MKITSNKKLIIPVFFGVVFVLAIVVWYSPIIFKGHSFQPISQDMLLAKNYHESGVFATQNNQSVVVSSDLTRDNGYQLPISKYLGSAIFAKIFNVIGIPDYNLLVLLSIILYAIVLVVFTILTKKIFGLKIAAIFSLIYIFSPIGWGLSYDSSGYGFCLLFLGVSLIFYFSGTKGRDRKNSIINILFLVFSGIFLGLSALSKEITLVFALAFFIFLVIKKLKKQLLYVFIPFAVLLIIFWLPSFLNGGNRYLSLITGHTTKANVALAELHLFPDAYTYYFEKDSFLKDFQGQDLGVSENIETKKVLANYGFGKITIFERGKVGAYALSQHLFRFVSLQEFGGPFILLLLILGLIYLKKKNKFLYNLSAYWVTISIFVFSFIILVSRNHLMDFVWPITLMVSLGVFYLLQIVKEHFKLNKTILIDIIIVVLILYHLFLVNRIVLGTAYDSESVPRILAYSREINEIEIKDNQVIAVPGDILGQDFSLAYLTGKSFVIFRPETLEKLLKENKIKTALDNFGVKYILGYSGSLSNEITNKTKTTNIASDSLNIEIEKTSETKSFLMNLFR